jgi:hypothetical protein
LLAGSKDWIFINNTYNDWIYQAEEVRSVLRLYAVTAFQDKEVIPSDQQGLIFTGK